MAMSRHGGDRLLNGYGAQISAFVAGEIFCCLSKKKTLVFWDLHAGSRAGKTGKLPGMAAICTLQRAVLCPWG
jgi:hypothetical protein